MLLDKRSDLLGFHTDVGIALQTLCLHPYDLNSLAGRQESLFSCPPFVMEVVTSERAK